MFDDQPLSVRLSNAEDGLLILNALADALNHPHDVLDLVLSASNEAVALNALCERFGFTELAARAVLDLQFGKTTVATRTHLLDERRDVIEQLGELRKQSG